MDTGTQAQPDPRSAGGFELTEDAQDVGGSQAAVAPGELGEEDEAVASAKAALERITRRLGDASRELNEIVNVLEFEDDYSPQLRDAQEVLSQIQSVENILHHIFKGERGQKPGDAFSAVTQASALVSDAEAARDRLPEPDPGGPKPPKPPKLPSWLRQQWDAAIANIKAALPHLWAFISRMVTPTQWTAEGSVSTGIFGFAGVSISVTFGKPD